MVGQKYSRLLSNVGVSGAAKKWRPSTSGSSLRSLSIFSLKKAANLLASSPDEEQKGRRLSGFL